MESELLNSLDPRQLGERIRDARKARGFTQEEVSSQLGLFRTTLVAIEKGDRKVTPRELIDLAKILGRPLSDFVTARENNTPFIPQFRLPPGSKPVSETELHAAVIELERLARDYLELEEINGATRRPVFPPLYPLDLPGVSADQRGEEVATEERARLGLGDGPISDLRSLLEESVGLRIFYLDLPPKVGGIYACNDELGACIAINRHHPPTRGNGYLAHEYGHFLTTRYLADVSFTHEHWGKLGAERFADSFAKNFLMPRTGVTRRLSDTVNAHGRGVSIGDIMSLAHLFMVSAETMFRRLEELRRIPPGKWDQLRGKHAIHPGKVSLSQNLGGATQPMLPLRYRLLAQNAYDHKEALTEGQLARKLRTDRISARLELESMRLMADDSSAIADGFSAIELDVSELVQA